MARSKQRNAVVRLSVVRDNRSSNAMRGITADMQKQAKQAEREAKKATALKEREAKKATQLSEREAKKRADAMVREAKRAAAQELRVHEQTMRTRHRVAIQWMRQESREGQRRFREQQRQEKRAAEQRRQTGRAIVGGAVGIGASAVAALTAAAAAISSFASSNRDKLGIVRPEDAILETKAAQEEFVRQMTTAGFGAQEQKAALDKLLESAQKFGAMPADMLSALNVAQGTFSDPNFVLNNSDFIAQLVRATGGSAPDLVGALLTEKKKFGLDDAATVDMGRILMAQSGEGSVEFKDMAGSFAPVFAQFVNTFGKSAMTGSNAALAGAVAQTAATSLAGTAESATMMKALLAKLADVRVQDKLRGISGGAIDIGDRKTGALKDPSEVFRQLLSSENSKFLTPANLIKVLGRQEPMVMLQTLMSTVANDPGKFERLAGQDASSGQAVIDQINENLRTLPTDKINQMQVEAQAVALTANGAINVATNAAALDVEAERQARNRLGDLPVALGLNGSVTAGAIGAYDAVVKGDSSGLTSLINAGGGTSTDADVGRVAGVVRTAAATMIPGMGPLLSMLSEFVNRSEAANANGAPAKTDSTIKVQIDGPGRVTDVQTTGSGSDVVVSNGVRGRNG